MDKRSFSDEQLSAWLDGELDTAAAAEVQAWLQANPEAAARVQQWAADRDALRGHFAQVLNEPVPPRLSAVAWQPVAWPRWAQAAAVAGLLVTGAVIGGAAVWQWRPGRSGAELAAAQAPRADGAPQGWVRRAALAHSVYVPEPRHAVEVRAQEEHLARWLTRRIDMPVHLFNLQAQGFELVGGRLLPDGNGKSAQLMYQDAQGRRVTVYLRRPEQAVETQFRYERQGDLGLFYWVEEGCGYALVGALPRDTLLALAEAVYHQHPKAATPPAAAPSAGAKG